MIPYLWKRWERLTLKIHFEFGTLLRGKGVMSETRKKEHYWVTYVRIVFLPHLNHHHLKDSVLSHVSRRHPGEDHPKLAPQEYSVE